MKSLLAKIALILICSASISVFPIESVQAHGGGHGGGGGGWHGGGHGGGGGGGWHGGGGGGWHGGGGHGGGWNNGGWNNGFFFGAALAAPFYYSDPYPYGSCYYVPGHHDPYGYWIPAHRECD